MHFGRMVRSTSLERLRDLRDGLRRHFENEESALQQIGCRERGEQIEEAVVGFAGVYGDRLFAFRDFANPKGFLYLTGREQQEMVLSSGQVGAAR